MTQFQQERVKILKEKIKKLEERIKILGEKYEKLIKFKQEEQWLK